MGLGMSMEMARKGMQRRDEGSIPPGVATRRSGIVDRLL